MTSLNSQIKTNTSNKGVGLIQFDLDGTILNTYEQILQAMRYTINEVYKKNLGDEELMHMVGVPIVEQFQKFVPEDPDKALKTYLEFEHANDLSVKAFDGIPELLEAIKQEGYRMVIVTSKRHEAAKRELIENNLISYFDALIGADDVPRGKPDPYPVVHAADLSGFPLQQVVYVGDSPYDMQAANSANVFSIAVDWGMFKKELLLSFKPDAYVYHPNEVLGEIKKLLPAQ